MKNAHIVTASSYDGEPSPKDSKDGVIRLKIDKPSHWDWQLTTSADTIPVIQLLDKDGRLLVETTGRTAQRAKGSFREGLTSHEEFPNPSKVPKVRTRSLGNRNFEGFSSKFESGQFGKPRKSRSDVDVRNEGRKSRKRNSSTEVISRSEGDGIKYSPGDYLRQQILDDLRTQETSGKTSSEIAEARYEKVRVYLRNRSDSSLNRESRERTRSPSRKRANRTEGGKSRRSLHSDESLSLDRRDVFGRRDTSNGRRYVSNARDISNGRDTSDLKDSFKTKENIYDTPFPQKTVNSFKIGKQLTKQDLDKIRGFLQDRISAKMKEEKLSRSRSQPIGTHIFPEIEIGEKESEKRYSDCSSNWKNHHIRKMGSDASVVRYSERQLQPSESRHNSEGSYDLRRKLRSRTRADALLEADEPENIYKERKPAEKRKVYSRKTKSDTLVGNLDSKKSHSQDNLERTWREYRERKKLDSKLDKLDTLDVEEEDFMKKPRWKDLQKNTCSTRNCRICENMKNCVDPFAHDDKEGSDQCRILNQYQMANQYQVSNQHPTSNHREQSGQSTPDVNSRSKTALQENYLVLERATSPLHDSIISETTTNSREEEVSSSSWNSPDFGYNSIPKQSRNYKEILCSNSTVKKSDTFKVVDGSEDVVEFGEMENPPMLNETSEVSCDSCDDLSEDIIGRSKTGKQTFTKRTNQEIADDYFLRVYELLKRRREEVKKLAQLSDESKCELETETTKNLKPRRRRRKRTDNSPQDKETGSTVFPAKEKTSEGFQGDLVNGDNLTDGFRDSKQHHQQQGQKTGTRKRRPPPPLPSSCNTYVTEKFDEKYTGNPSKRNESRHNINGQGLSEGGFNPPEMGSNLSRHNAGKGLTGRRTQSSGNLCDAKGKLNSVGKIFVPCSSASRESRYKFCGSLPNHLDDKEGLEIESGENNNVIHSDVGGNLPGTLPHQKRLAGLHISDNEPPFGTFDLVKRPSQDSLEGDPWRYRLSDEFEPGKCQLHSLLASKNSKGSDTVDKSQPPSKTRFSFSKSKEKIRNRHDNDTNRESSSFKEVRRDSSINRKVFEEGGGSRRRRFSTKNSVDDELISVVHKPNCKLVKHRLHSALSLDLTQSKLSGNEPQDQGYASERSPEDEQPPSLPGQDELFPNVTPENTFRVVLEKSNRGLGLSVSGGGTAGPVRVKRLFPQQPAALSHKLEQGDILLAANGIPLTGLTNYEALEVLRTTSNKVELVVCRLPDESTGTSPDIPLPPPPPPIRREPPPPLRILNPLPPLQIEPCGEFDIEMMKVGGSLGFTLRKADSSALGHYIRALVREPALSDERIRPGDKIVAVDGAPLSPMSHEEAVALLRQCGPKVKLRLYRDLAQTPVSALSPTEPDHPLRPPRTSLRQEAVDMLCDLAVRKLSPGTYNGLNDSNQSTSGFSASPRKLRRLGLGTSSTETDHGTKKRSNSSHDSTLSQGETSESDQCSIKTQITNSQPDTPADDIIDPPSLYDVDSYDSSKAARPSFLDLDAPQDKPSFQFSIKTDSKHIQPVVGEKSSNLGNSNTLSSDELDGNLPSEPASMPPVLTNNDATFSHKNPAYQSANPASSSKDNVTKSKVTHSSDQDIPGKVFGNEEPGGSKGLLKWKGVMFAPDDEGSETTKNGESKETLPTTYEEGDEVFMVELTRGWNSRLGFSLQPEGNQTVVSVVYPDSVAAKDGRLKEGDVLIMINDESVEEMSTGDIIDLLRKVRGSIGITVLRKRKQEQKT